MSACVYCGARPGKRACPARGGEICPSCCGKHRMVEIDCPPDCRWLGGLAAVRSDKPAEFSKADYNGAVEKLQAYASSSRGRAAHPDVLRRLFETDPRPAYERDREPIPAWLEPLLFAHLMYGYRGPDGLRAIDRFLAGFGRGLAPGEVAALRTLQDAWPSMFEITAVRIGAGLTVRDLLLDETFDVREVSATTQVHRGDVLYGWMMRVGDLMELTGASAFVARHCLDAERRRLAQALAAAQAARPDVAPRRLLGDLAEDTLLALRAAVYSAPRPQLQTTHGEPLLFSEARYAITDLAAVRKQLPRMPDLDDDGTGTFVWTDSTPNAALGGGPTVLGRIRIDGDALVLETHSRERLTRGRAMLEAALGAHLTHRADAFTDPEAALRDAPRSDDASPDDIPPELQAEVLGQFLADHYRAWIDEPVPAFKNRTPRKMASTKRGRAEVAAMIDDFEQSSHDQPGATPELWNGLRRELGIPLRVRVGEGLVYDADRAPDPRAWLAADEDVTAAAIRAHHATLTGHPPPPHPELHARMHAIVENQLAADDAPESQAALARLMAEGATRHEALHALISVLAVEIDAMMKTQRIYDRDKVKAGFAQLRARDWVGSLG